MEDKKNIRIFDYDSPLENTVRNSAIACLCLAALVWFINSGVNTMGVKSFWSIIIFISLAVILFISRYFISCYWSFDMDKREIHFCRKLIFIETDQIHGKFEDISGFGVFSKFISFEKGSSARGDSGIRLQDDYWKYCLILLMKDGELIQLSDYIKDDYVLYNDQAKELSREFNVRNFEFSPEIKVKVVMDSKTGDRILVPNPK